MSKGSIFWNLFNSITIIIFFFVILFSYGEFPVIKERITKTENRLDAIDYHLQCPSNNRSDTIVINCLPVTKNKK